MWGSVTLSLGIALAQVLERFLLAAQEDGVGQEPRRLGTSNYTLRKLTVHALNMLTGFSTWPLRLASLSPNLITRGRQLEDCKLS